MSDNQQTRQVVTRREVAIMASRLLLIVLAPFLVLGTVLTVSIFGAILGAPLLLVTGPIARIAWKIHNDPERTERFRWLNVCAHAVAAILTVTWLGTSVYAIGDLDSQIEWSLFALAILWIGLAWWTVRLARRLVSD